MTRRLINLVDHETQVAVATAAIWFSVIVVLSGIGHLSGLLPASQPAQTQECPR